MSYQSRTSGCFVALYAHKCCLRLSVLASPTVDIAFVWSSSATEVGSNTTRAVQECYQHNGVAYPASSCKQRAMAFTRYLGWILLPILVWSVGGAWIEGERHSRTLWLRAHENVAVPASCDSARVCLTHPTGATCTACWHFICPDSTCVRAACRLHQISLSTRHSHGHH